MKKFLRAVILCLVFPICSFAQTPSVCRDIYVWDFVDNNGKRLSDANVQSDMELALSSYSECRVFEQKTNSDLEVAKKNERLSTKSDALSESLSKKLSEKGIKHVMFGTVTEKNSDVMVDLKILSVNTKNAVYTGVFTMNRNDFYGNRAKRRDAFKDFIINKILKKPSPVKLIVPVITTIAGAGVVAYGLLKTGSTKSDWQTAFDKNPFDKALYDTQNKTYKTNQYIAIGGGVVMAVGAFLLVKKIAERKKYSQSTGLTDVLSKPKSKFIIEPIVCAESNIGLGVGLRF
jgi:FlgO protein